MGLGLYWVGSQSPVQRVEMKERHEKFLRVIMFKKQCDFIPFISFTH